LLDKCHAPDEQGILIEFDFGNKLVRGQTPTDGTTMKKDPREMDYDVLYLVELVILLLILNCCSFLWSIWHS
jgi:hypothetical protein